MIWKGIDNNNRDLNKIGNIYGKYSLVTHNIGFSIGILLTIILKFKRKLNFKDFIPLIVSIIFFIFIVVYYYLPNNYSDISLPLDPNCKKKDCQNYNNRLLWSYPHEWYIYSFLISLFLLFMYVNISKSKILACIVFILSYILSYIYKPKVAGSVWCFMAAILAPVLVSCNYYIIKDLNILDTIT